MVTIGGHREQCAVMTGTGTQGHPPVNCADKRQELPDSRIPDGLSVIEIRRVIQDMARPFLQFARAQFGDGDARCEFCGPGAGVTPTCTDGAAVGTIRSTGTVPARVLGGSRRRRGRMMRGDRPGRAGEVRAWARPD